MRTKEEILAEINKVEETILKPLNEEFQQIISREADEVDAKIQRCKKLEDKFTLAELRFSATARCQCGAGLAYPHNIGAMKGAWYCSDILLGRALAKDQPGSKTHDSSYPFAFYEIKSEGQPSAYGQTTRPKK